jgi:hypothetical protein
MRSSLDFPALRRSTALRLAIVGALMVAASAFPSLPALGQSGPDCTSNADCPPPQICCPVAGYYGAPKVCRLPPPDGHCPYLP